MFNATQDNQIARPYIADLPSIIVSIFEDWEKIRWKVLFSKASWADHKKSSSEKFGRYLKKIGW